MEWNVCEFLALTKRGILPMQIDGFQFYGFIARVTRAIALEHAVCAP